MKDISLLVVRVVAGGALVVAFAMISDVLKPKMFAGLFSAAPSVATASLLLTGLAMGPAKAQSSAAGMVAGAVGLVAFCLAAVVLVNHLGAVAGSLVGWVVWVGVALSLYWVFLR